MQTDQLRQCLDSASEAEQLFDQWKLQDRDLARRNLRALATTLGVDKLSELCHPLGRILPRCPDPDMAFNNLERFLDTTGGLGQIDSLLESRARTLEILMQLLSTSQFFCDLLISDPDLLGMVRIPLRNSPSRNELLGQLQSEVGADTLDSAMLRAFRRFRKKQILRIGTNDIFRDRPLEEITRDISLVADVSLEVALLIAQRQVSKRFGTPQTGSGEPARCVIMAFGKLGGRELNYSSDIDLMFLYDEEGYTRGTHSEIDNDDYFARVLSEVIRLLSAFTENGQAYRIDMRLRPEGLRGPLARSIASTLSYYDSLGRTWERQALIKLRPAAGDIKLGEEFLRRIEPFVYRKYLSLAEINEIKALKRRIEHKTGKAGESDTEVKTGHGGIRDIEFTIQFLQLLNGGDLADVRERNTLLAMQALEKVGCLSDTEYRALEKSYRFLRKVEHRLQLMFDLQTHSLPIEHDELRKLALRMGYEDTHSENNGQTSASNGIPDPAEQFLDDYRSNTTLNRKILDHLLHQTFEESSDQAKPETDLILDPDPSPESIEGVLGKYPFRDPQAAYQNLMELARETVPFLSTRRCRHFLASIAPYLLRALAKTPDPDMALVNLEKVSASIGGKGVLWELFSFNEPSLHLYVDLCAWSQFLSEILINNPGMVDELLDSLVLNQPREIEGLQRELRELCRGPLDPVPILHSFRDKELLRIGVRDILGKDTVRETTAALSDLAETILTQIASMPYEPLIRRFGVPYIADGERAGGISRYALLGLGKLGGREMSYHSDLDLVFVYEADGKTGPPKGSSRFDRFDLTDNFHFFTELARQMIRTTSHHGPMGQLYQVDMRLRPTGRSGSLVIPLSEFERYYESGGAQLWERQALTRARFVAGHPDFGEQVMKVVKQAAYGLHWRPEYSDEIKAMRERLEASGSERDVKRGYGGIVDVEFIVQLLRLKHGRKHAQLQHPNTWESLAAAQVAGLLSPEQHQTLISSFEFLRLVESRLRIVHNRSLDELPDRTEDIVKLARRLGFESEPNHSAGTKFFEAMDRSTTEIRELFLKIVKREKAKQ